MQNNYPELAELVKKYIPQISSSHYIGNNIPKQKLEAAIHAYAPTVDATQVLGILDQTVMGSCKEGVLFTTSALYVHIPYDCCFRFPYAEIKSVNVTGTVKVSSITTHVKLVKDCKRILEITLNDDSRRTIKSETLNKTPFQSLLEQIIALVKENKTAANDKYLIIQDLSYACKSAYLSVVMTFANADGDINAAELNRLYSLCVRINTSPELRKSILHSPMDYPHLADYLDALDCGNNKSSMKAIYISLIKDVFVVADLTYDRLNQTQSTYLNQLMNRAGIDKNAVLIIQDSIQKERDYINGKISEKQYIKAMENVAAGAAAAGVPIAALYLSGSVAGLSAAGITSGLAALGLGGVLGLSSMVTGVGVLLVLGVAAYNGVKMVSKIGKEKEVDQRELLRQAAVRANEKVITALIEDLNFVTNELVDVATQNEINAEKIKILSLKIKILKDAFTQSTKAREENSIELAVPEEVNACE